MATTLTKTVAPGKWSQSGIAVTMAAGDVGSGNDFPQDRDLLLVAHNTSGATPYYVTITSQADPTYGRTGDVNQQDLAAGEIRVFRLTGPGWADGNGNINVQVENAAIELGVIVL